MATIAFITKRIDGKEKEVERLRKKIARIEEAEASGWEKNPYFYSDSDLRSARQDLDEAIKGLEPECAGYPGVPGRLETAQP